MEFTTDGNCWSAAKKGKGQVVSRAAHAARLPKSVSLRNRRKAQIMDVSIESIRR